MICRQTQHAWIAAPILDLLLLSACGQSGDAEIAAELAAPATAQGESAPADSGKAAVLLTATSRPSTFKGQPSCFVDFRVENRGGAALKTLSAAETSFNSYIDGPLAMGATSKAWPVNVLSVARDQVQLQFSDDKLTCPFEGSKCQSIDVRQEALTRTGGIRS